MAKRITSAIVTNDLHEHPAFKAWATFCSGLAHPKSIVTLKEKRKSKVYRIQGVGPSGSIIAKQCNQATAKIERSLYEEVFPYLPVSTPHFYGFTEDPDRDFLWLFLEDAGDHPCSYLIEDHRLETIYWLAGMHLYTWSIDLPTCLPDRGPSHYLDYHLHAAVDVILKNLANPVLTREDRKTLRRIISRLKFVESHGNEIVDFCARMPKTLVHGDFVEKNVRVRRKAGGITILPIDWETAGFGVPVADVAVCQDSKIYWSLVRETWSETRMDEIRRLTIFGKICRMIASFSWASWDLAFDWADRHIKVMRSYELWLDEFLRSAGWAR